jgi:hypothetical protein
MVAVVAAIAAFGGLVLMWLRATPPASDTDEVTGWRELRLVSVVDDGSSVILACRRRPDRSPAPVPDDGLLARSDRTMVLHLGGGYEAGEARLLLEQWQRDAVWLRVRPVAGEPRVELVDGHGRSCLRAPLVSV